MVGLVIGGKAACGETGQLRDFQRGSLKTQWKLPVLQKEEGPSTGPLHTASSDAHTQECTSWCEERCEFSLLFFYFNETTSPETDHSPTMERFWIFTLCKTIGVPERKRTSRTHLYEKRLYQIGSQNNVLGSPQRPSAHGIIARFKRPDGSQPRSGAEGLEDSWKTCGLESTFKACRSWVLIPAAAATVQINLPMRHKGNEAESFFLGPPFI